jgi:hypothetical protein
MTDEWIEKTGGGENALERSIGSLKTLILTKALYVDGENVM